MSAPAESTTSIPDPVANFAEPAEGSKLTPVNKKSSVTADLTVDVDLSSPSQTYLYPHPAKSPTSPAQQIPNTPPTPTPASPRHLLHTHPSQPPTQLPPIYSATKSYIHALAWSISVSGTGRRFRMMEHARTTRRAEAGRGWCWRWGLWLSAAVVEKGFSSRGSRHQRNPVVALVLSPPPPVTITHPPPLTTRLPYTSPPPEVANAHTPSSATRR
ncbi:hypothetical protein V500_10266 [Pseudogymnoascus sp. VKM F-4518 (FW-2643)]|nr:hypothetical protein V500_10266 [Pseudogymnoascus sp. VKM F-4518 (FW-2643)]